MSGEHVHGPPASAAGRHVRPLTAALLLTASFAVVEVAVGFAVGSLALVSDAGHMLTDVAGLGMALAAIQVARAHRSPSATYGLYRLEVLAALANAVLLFGIALYVLVEAWSRFQAPADIPGAWLLAVAAVGLAVNLVAFLLLRVGARESINVRGAFLEVMSDMLGSVGVILAGVILVTTGWAYADPIVGVGIGLFILPRAYRLGRDALRVLLQVAPPDVNLESLRQALGGVEGVGGVHDLHVWTLTSGLRVVSGHLALADGPRPEDVLGRATRLLRDMGLEHVTLQIETPGFCADEGNPV